MRSSAAVAAIALLACSSAVDLRVKEPTPTTIRSEAKALRGTDHLGQRFDLRDVATRQATVVIFYRGHW